MNNDLDAINRLDDQLDRLLAGDGPGDPDGLAAAVRSALVLEVSPQARVAHLELLTGRRPARRSSFGRRVAVIGLAAAMSVSLLGSSAFAASSGAVAGEPLFGVKRAFERAAMSMRFGKESKTAFAFEIAQRRLSELHAVGAQGKRREHARAAYEAALADAGAVLGDGEGLDDDLLAHVEAQLQKHVGVLNELLGKVPEEARAGIERAIDNASKAEEKVMKGRGGPDPSATPPGKQEKSGRSGPARSGR